MKALKEIIKKKMLPLFMCMYRESKHLDVIKAYAKGRENWKKKRSANVFPKVVFIIQFPEVWSSLCTVYKALESVGADPVILCVPKPSTNHPDEYIPSDCNEAYDFFQKMEIPAVDAYDAHTGSWFDLEGQKPDYVMYARPYNKQYPALYKSTCVCGYANVCYIPYAYTLMITGLSYVTFNFEFLLTTYLTFNPSRISFKECQRRFIIQRLTKSHKFIFCGFPRFDLLKTCLAEDKKTDGKRKTILWLPRWTVYPIEGQRMSNFLKYLDSFFDYMERHPEIDLIIRPHPLMYQTILEKKIWTQGELDAFMKKVDHADNIRLDEDKDYMVSFGKSDILLSDYSALLIEYFVLGKPIIYCDIAEDFNLDALLMDASLYHAMEWDEVEEQLTGLLNGEDPLLEKRKEAIHQLMPSNAGGIGEEIARYILEDFKSAQDKREKGLNG